MYSKPKTWLNHCRLFFSFHLFIYTLFISLSLSLSDSFSLTHSQSFFYFKKLNKAKQNTIVNLKMLFTWIKLLVKKRSPLSPFLEGKKERERETAIGKKDPDAVQKFSESQNTIRTRASFSAFISVSFYSIHFSLSRRPCFSQAPLPSV